MFKTYEEAREYAIQRDKEDSARVSVILTKDGKYNVARDWDEAEYAMSRGWVIAEK